MYIRHSWQGLFASGEGAALLRSNVTGTGKVERCKTSDHDGWTDSVRDVHVQKRAWWNGREVCNSTSHEGQSITGKNSLVCYECCKGTGWRMAPKWHQVQRLAVFNIGWSEVGLFPAYLQVAPGSMGGV